MKRKRIEKRISIGKRRWLLYALVLFCVLQLCGCGKEPTVQEEKTEVTTDGVITDYTYMPEYTEIHFMEEAEGDRFMARYTRLGEDRVYYSIRAFRDGEPGSNNYIHYRDFQNMNQPQKVPQEVFAVGENIYVEGCTFDSQKQLYVLWSGVESEGYFLSKYSADYQLMYTKDLSGIWMNDMNSYIGRIMVDGEGRIYGTSQNVLYILTPEGELEKTVKLGTSSMNNLFFQEDGRLYMSYYDKADFVLAEINITEGKKEEPIRNIPYGCNEIWAGIGDRVLLDRAGKLWEYDLNTQELKELLTWSDMSINEENITGLRMTREGEIMVLCLNYSDDNPLVPECEVVALRKVDRAKVPVKETITLATIYQSDGYLTEAVAEFNKKSNQYRVEIKSYMDEGTEYTERAYEDALNRFYAELVNGEAGDIINLKNMDWRNLARKGALEELTPYMSDRDGLQKEDFLESVVKAYEVDGKCYTIPRGFSIETLMGKKSVVGSRKDWGLEKVEKLVEQYPDAKMIHMGNSYMLLQFCMQYGGDRYVDYESMECAFDNPEFVAMLEFCKRGGSGQTPNMDLYGNVKMDRVLLSQVSIRSVMEYQMYHQLFMGEGVSVGYPTIDGGGRTILAGEEMLAMASGSKKKGAAWMFLESFLKEEAWSGWVLPSRKDDFDREVEEACLVEYLYDEQGNIQYDEAGVPLQKQKTTWGYGSFEAVIYAATEEEINGFLELLEYADCNRTEEEIRKIMNEEVAAYFEGQKSADEVARIIQNRVQLYLDENT